MTKAVPSLSHVVLMGIRPEQDFTGYVVQESNDLLEGESVMNWHLGDVKDLRLSWFQPGGIAAIVAQFPKTLGDVKSVIYRHTCYPLFKAFMAPDKADALYQFHVNGSLASTWTYRYRHERPLPARLAICPDCFDEDVENFGYPIRRRLHLVGGILACHLHKRTLLASCGICDNNPRRNKSLWDVQKQCGCARPLKEIQKLTGQELDVAISVASMAQQILDGYDTRPITNRTIVRAIQMKARELSENPYQFLTKSMLRSLGTKGMSSMKLAEGSIKAFTNAALRRTQSPVLNLTVIYAVFGSLDELTQYIKTHESTLSNEINSLGKTLPVLDKDNVERLTKKYRKWLEEQLLMHPDMPRYQLRRQPKGSLAVPHLRNHDKEYFDEKVPRIYRGTLLKKTAQEHREKLHIIRVATLVEHIEARYRQMLSTRPTERIFMWYLLGEAPNKNVLGIKSDPAVRAALERYSDDRKTWLMRKAEIISARISRIGKKSPYAALSTFANSKNPSVLQAKIYAAEKWLKQETAKSSAPL